MKLENQVETRTIDPRVFNDMTEEAAITMLEVAHDMRSGIIKKHEFYMLAFHSFVDRSKPFSLGYNCGTTHCICGWMEFKLKKGRDIFIKGFSKPLRNLFAIEHGWNYNPYDVYEAANAIENYLFYYASQPWNS